MKKREKKQRKPVNPIRFILVCALAFFSVAFYFSSSVAYAQIPEEGNAYDPEQALAYAKEHWNDPGQANGCVRFVKKALTNGGLVVNSTDTARSLFNTLASMGYEPHQAITEQTSYGLIVPMEKNQIMPGDVVITFCPLCGSNGMYKHAVLAGGTNSNGYLTVFAHNTAKNNETFYADDSHSSHINYLTVYYYNLSDAVITEEDTSNFTVEVSSLKIPTGVCLRQGQHYGLDGIITSDSKNLSQISGTIINSDSQQMVQFTSSLFLTPLDRISIADTIDEGMVFNALPPGAYTLTIRVYNTDNEELVISDTEFTIVNVNKLSGRKRR